MMNKRGLEKRSYLHKSGHPTCITFPSMTIVKGSLSLKDLHKATEEAVEVQGGVVDRMGERQLG